MGKRKYLGRIEELFDKSPVVGFKSIEKIIGKKKNSSYAKLLVRNQILKKKIFRLAKGCYTKHNESSLSVFCFKPSYIGLQSALSFHGLWEQETIPVIVTSRNVRTGSREVNRGNLIIKKLKSQFLFGFEYFEEGGFYLPYSDVEKTFIDMTYFKQALSEDALKNFRKKIDKNKLEKYVKLYPKGFRRKVLDAYRGE